jgi:hypothetical protein
MLDDLFKGLTKMDISIFTETANSLKLAAEVIKSFLELNIGNKRDEPLVTAHASILKAAIDANAAVEYIISLKQEINDLEHKLCKLAEWNNQKDQYQLTTPWPGCHIYAVKIEFRDVSAPHWICPTCYEKDKRSILQCVKQGGYGYLLVCHNESCRTEIHTGFKQSPPIADYV